MHKEALLKVLYVNFIYIRNTYTPFIKLLNPYYVPVARAFQFYTSEKYLYTFKALTTVFPHNLTTL